MLEEGDLLAALPWLVEMMEPEDQGLARRPAESAAKSRVLLARLAAVLRQCPRPLQVWTHHRPLRATFFSSDGCHVLVAAASMPPEVLDAETGECVTRLAEAKGATTTICFSPDGRLVMTAGSERARLWDAGTCKHRHGLGHGAGIWHAAFSPDGRFVATAGGDGTGQVWEAGAARRGVGLHPDPAVRGAIG
jgi:hypothetical protein